MTHITRRATLAGALAIVPAVSQAASAADLDTSSTLALARLYEISPKAHELDQRAKAVLIFPKITKAGFLVGGQFGDGVLRVGGRTEGYYRIAAASFGLQAGAQTFSYALFFITQSALDFLDRSGGWAIGSGPSVVVADEGMARSMNSTTLTQDVYAVPFGQSGLMAGLGLEGSKISRITPDA